MSQSVTLSSAGTATIVLNPVAKSTTIQLTNPTVGSSLTVVSVEASLDDPSAYPAQTMRWAVISSGVGMLSSLQFSGGLTYTLLSPISAVRLNSTTNAGSSGVFAMTVLQSVTA